MELESANYMRKAVKSRLANYIRSNNREKLSHLLANEANMELLRNERYFNPFVIAIREDRLQMFDVLLASGLELDGVVRRASRNGRRKKRKRRHAKRQRSAPNKPKKTTSSDSDMIISESDAMSLERVPVSPSGGSYSNTLIEAIKCVNLAAVERLIRLTVNVNSTNYRQIPLQIAYNVYSDRRDRYLTGSVDDFDQYEVTWHLEYRKG